MLPIMFVLILFVTFASGNSSKQLNYLIFMSTFIKNVGFVGFAVFEYNNGGKICVSKVYPTWLGAKRVRNKIHRDCSYFRHTVEQVFSC